MSARENRPGNAVEMPVAAADVEAVEDMTRTLRALDHRHGGGRCLDVVMASLPAADALLGVPATDPIASRLRRAVADLHNLAGWVCFDTGLRGDAVRQFGRALELATEGGDDALAANVHYRLGRVHLHHNAPRRACAEFQRGARTARAGGSALTKAILCANLAWAFARMGARDDALAQLTRAHEEFGRADLTTALGWEAFFTATDLTAITGVVYSELAQEVDLGYTALALPQLAAAAAGYDQGMTRSKAFCLMSLATCHLLADEFDHAVAAGHQAIDLCQDLGSIRTADRLRLLSGTAAHQSAHPGVRTLLDRIAAFRPAAIRAQQASTVTQLRDIS